MKRRGDEAQFVGPRTGTAATAAHHRILAAQNVSQPPTIQYQLNSGVLKVAASTNNNNNNNITGAGVVGLNNINNNNSNNNNNSISVSGTNTSNNSCGSGPILATLSSGGITTSNNNTTTVEVINSVVGNSSQQATIIGVNSSQGPPQAQYTTYPCGMTVTGSANVVTRSPTVTQHQALGAQQQQIHIVNASGVAATTASNAAAVSAPVQQIRHKGTNLGSGTSTTIIGGNATSIVTIPPQQSTIQQQHQAGMITINSGIPVGTGPTPPSVVSTTSSSSGPPPTPPSSGGGGVGGPGSGQFQRLKVEDALVYLDNVKSKFGNYPQVYNDFLDIMKEFKSQSIDTPGVIERVSTLFKGHPDLIVGFNTFLPPGYKIEIQANDTGYSYQVSVSMPDRSTTGGPCVQQQQQQQSPPQKMQIIQTSGPMLHAGGGPVNLMTHHAVTTTATLHHSMPATTIQAATLTNNSNNISGAPTAAVHLNNSINMPQSVSNVNANNQGAPMASYVIRGGSTGPGGGVPEKERTNSGGGGTPANNMTPSSVGQQQPLRTPMEELNSQGHNLHQISQAHHIMQQQAAQQQDVSNVVNMISNTKSNSGGNQNHPVEFELAISYVNKIKKRFQQQPDKYKRFLEILHQYQKEQKTVRGEGGQMKTTTEQEVYSQVAILFGKDEDLLKEFGQFLPDAASHSSLHNLNKSALIGHTNNSSGPGIIGAADHKKLGAVGIGMDASNAGLIRSGTNMSSGPGMIRFNNNTVPNNASNSSFSRTAGAMLGSGGLSVAMLNNEFGGMDSHKDVYQQMHGSGGSLKEGSRNHVSGGPPQKYGQVKRSPSSYGMGRGGNHGMVSDNGPPPSKRHKPIGRDVTLAEASKFGTLVDYAFFDKVRKAVRSPEVYDNFLRCLILFNQEIVSKTELLNLTAPFLSKFPDLHRYFQEFLGPAGNHFDGNSTSSVQSYAGGANASVAGPSGGGVQRQERSQSDHGQDIDLSTCKRLGASYCALPKTSELRKCSGRTALCKEVLNDTWVSFPTWAEDSTFVTSRKTQYEEIIYRCEDERFELDVVLETNSATIRVLEGVQKKLSRMSPEEVARFTLDDCLGGNSPTIHQRALRRIYGEKAADIIQGLKKNPGVAVPVVLRRLKAKEEEWREAQKGFNKQWRDQNEKYYLKSLDHQGINFKQSDIKSLRSKSLFNEIETLYDERHEHNEDNGQEHPMHGPHLVLPYKDKSILEDAANLLIHHVKRQTGIQKLEKTKIKQILRQFVPDLFFSPRQQLSDDEREDEKGERDQPMDVDEGGSGSNAKAKGKSGSNDGNSNNNGSNNSTTTISTASVAKSENSITNSGNDAGVGGLESNVVGGVNSELNTSASRTVKALDSRHSGSKDNYEMCMEIKEETLDTASDCDSPMPLPPHAISKNAEEAYTLFFANNNWYLFLRLHAILCERLRMMYDRAQLLAAEEAHYKTTRRESTATALRLKPKSEIQVEEYYTTFLDMLKNVLDGNLEATNYEDSLREMFGIHAYTAFTLDRVVSNAVRQLQHCVTERNALDCVSLFMQEQKRNGAGGYCRTASKRTAAEIAYQRRAEQSLLDENCFKVYIYKMDCRVTIELLDTEPDDTERCVSISRDWSTYVERYTNPGTTNSGCTSSMTTTSVTSSSTQKTLSSLTSGGASVVNTLSASSTTTITTSTKHSNSGAPGTTLSASGTTKQDGGGGIDIKVEKSDEEMNHKPRALFLRRNVRKRGDKAKMLKPFDLMAAGGGPVAGDTAIGVTGAISATLPDGLSAASEAEVKGAIEAQKSKVSNAVTGKSGQGSVKGKGYFEMVDPFLDKRPPERMGENSTVNSGYHVVDCTEVKLNINSYKMVLLTNKHVIFYKPNSMRRAKQIHEAVTKRMKQKFKRFVDNWLAKSVTESQQQHCTEWLMGRTVDTSQLSLNLTTVRLQENDIKRTPYALFNRYKVIKIER